MNSRLRLVLVGTTLIILLVLASVSLIYAAKTALRDSADLERRFKEVVLFRSGANPYSLKEDMTYPPSAPPVFTALVPTGSQFVRRVVWIGLNFAALTTFCLLVIRGWGRSWPISVQLAFVLVVLASKPARAGIALGQFHLIPLALIVAAEVAVNRRIFSGLLVGLSLVKPTMSLPYLLVLVVRRRYLSFFTALAVQALLFGAVSFWLKLPPWLLIREWLSNARAQTALGTIDLPSLVGRSIPALSKLAFPITGLVLILTLGILWRFRNRSRLGLLALATFAAAIMTYHRHYDLVLLLPTLAYLIDTAVKRRGVIRAWAAGFGLMLVVPSDGKYLGVTLEHIYDILFVVISYFVLTVIVLELKREKIVTKSPSSGETIRD